MRYFLCLVCCSLLGFGCTQTQPEQTETDPDWAKGIVWYQIFPERFHNADPGNDPDANRARGPENWKVSEWTSDWYARDDWEEQASDDFYGTVFNRRYGGDLQGVIDKLDYLKELGIGGIYFNPVFDAQSLHKYDASYYHHIDRNFGSNPEADVAQFEAEDPGNAQTWAWTEGDKLFLTLIEEAHKRDIKVVIDGVFNHTGTEFWAFQDLVRNQEKSAYKDWYIVTSYDDPSTPQNEFDYEGWWGFKGLPVFREEEGNLIPPIREHVFDVTRRWMDPNGDGDPSDGIDGWRLDVAEEVGHAFWKEWHGLVKEINPDAITIAEIWTDKAREFLTDDQFNSVMNYRFAYAAKDWIIDHTIDPQEFADRLMAVDQEYPQGMKHQLQNLMDSHDTARLPSIIVNPGRGYDREGKPRDGFDVRKPTWKEWEIQRLVALLQFTWQGAPMIYYGTEAGMWGADDPDDRKPMLWEELEYAPETHHPYGENRPADPNVFDAELFRYYQQLIQMRNDSRVLQMGVSAFELIDVERDLVVFKRSLGNETVFVAINASDTAADVAIPLGADVSKAMFVNALDATQSFQPEDNVLRFEVAPLSGLVLK
ncbi:MAG: glycoside hydrolase family 13 protein [Bacteroidota bacterium]